MALTRRVRYAGLRKGIRRLITEHIEKLTHGAAQLASAEPLVVRTKWGEVEVRLNEEIELAVKPELPAELAAAIVALTSGALRIPYERLRGILFWAAKEFLPGEAQKHVTATFEFSENAIHFEGTRTPAVKFTGDLVFGESELELRLELHRMGAFLLPLAASKIDALLREWTDY